MARKSHGNEPTDDPTQRAEAGASDWGSAPELELTPPDGDDGVAPASEAPGGAEVKELRARVAELEQQVEQERDRALRTQADFQNFRRRIDEQRAEQARFATRELLLGLLPIIDNFERALAASERTSNYEALVGGVSLTLRQLHDFLSRNGVAPIEAMGEEFDPNLHEAVMRVDDSDHPENSVVEELRRGYTMHDRVLRPSMVKVARG
ncbi:MAG: nucleotide exchange factor GrpE [Chthonomonadales bacterium]|nr:nucleotide exchange factor GrpE [Chthonomonadales bacterium]